MVPPTTVLLKNDDAIKSTVGKWIVIINQYVSYFDDM